MNIAVLGMGSISSRHRKNLKKLYPNANIIVMPARERVVDIQHVENADVVVNNMDEMTVHPLNFAIVASPASLHIEQTLMLVKSNIPVLIEKPVGLKLEQVQVLEAELALNPTQVNVAYCLRFMPALETVKKILDQQQLGSILNIHSEVGQFLPDWRSDKDYTQSVSSSLALGGGALFELSHEFDYLHYLFGDLSHQHSHLRCSAELKLEVEDLADVMLTTKSGAVCYVHLDFLQETAQRSCTITGTKGRLNWDLIENKVSVFTNQDETVIFSDQGWDKNEMYLSMINDFVLKDGRACSLLDAKSTLELILTIKASSKIVKAL
jgi:predicted dehydrogenase